MDDRKIYIVWMQTAVRFNTPCIYYKFGHTQCKQAITCRVFSGNLQKLFVSVQRLQRVWCVSERLGGWQQARKCWFLSQSGRLDLLKAALQTQYVLKLIYLSRHMNAVYLLLKVWFYIYTCISWGCLCKVYWGQKSVSHFFLLSPEVASFASNESS